LTVRTSSWRASWILLTRCRIISAIFSQTYARTMNYYVPLFGEPLWLSGRVVKKWDNKWNRDDPGLLPTPRATSLKMNYFIFMIRKLQTFATQQLIVWANFASFLS
jgi:hypothetical protein